MRKGIQWQVSSVELSQKLRELGVKQESYFDWYIGTDEDCSTWLLRSTLKMRSECSDYCSAFTTAELGNMLGKKQGIVISTISSTLDQSDQRWSVCLYKSIEHIEAATKQHKAGIYQIGHLDHIEIEPTEADARAAMVIYLIENGLLDPSTL